MRHGPSRSAKRAQEYSGDALLASYGATFLGYGLFKNFDSVPAARAPSINFSFKKRPRLKCGYRAKVRG